MPEQRGGSLASPEVSIGALRAFYAVAQTGSFSRAAAILRVRQPAVSKLGTCAPPGYPDCHTVCHETGSGLVVGSFATARTADGAVWLTYVTSALDVDRTYAGEDGFQEECYTQRDPATDHSTGTLHVIRVPLDGSGPELIHEEAFPEPGLDYYDGQGEAVRARAFGTRLVVALRTFDPAHLLDLRILQFETAGK